MWGINIDIVKIKKNFENLHLKFFLEGGVFLGTAREKNFISWDC